MKGLARSEEKSLRFALQGESFWWQCFVTSITVCSTLCPIYILYAYNPFSHLFHRFSLDTHKMAKEGEGSVNKKLLAFLNGLARRKFFEEEITDEMLRDQVLGGVGEEGER